MTVDAHLAAPAPLISILIPCHNAAPWLKDTLESALAQSSINKEVLVVDDGSTDASLAIARSFEPRGVRVIAQPNRGASAARNAGMAAATGDWFQFLDADDLLAPDKLQRQLELANRVGPEFAVCGRWSRFRTSVADADFTPQPLCVDAPPVDWMVIKLEQHRMMHPAAWLISRRLAERAGNWNETLSLDDDGEYFSRVVLASSGTRCCHEAVSYYRSRIPGSLSQKRSERALASAFASLELSMMRLLAIADTPQTRRACAVALQRYIYEAYPYARQSRARARALVVKLGGCALEPDGGPLFQRTRRVLGWKAAKRLQLVAYALRRSRAPATTS